MNDATIEVQVPVELSQDEKAHAGLAHALMISTWWIRPLILYRIGRQWRFEGFDAPQAPFWLIIFAFLYFMGMAVFTAVAFASELSRSQGKPPQPDHFPVGMLIALPIFWLTTMGGFAISMTLGIVYCLKAIGGEWAGYPLSGRWACRIVGA